MIIICRSRCIAAVIGLLAAVSAVLIVPQHAPAQTNVVDEAAVAADEFKPGSNGGTGVSSPAAPVTGSRPRVAPLRESTADPDRSPAAEGAVLESGQAIYADMARTARSGGKPAASIAPGVASFLRPTAKPAPAGVGTAPPPLSTESEPPKEAVVARVSETVASEATATEAGAADQQATLSPAWNPTQPPAVASLTFAPDSATLNGDAESVLKDLAARFPADDEALRLQLLAYASGEGMSASKARRLSLARALTVRAYLIENGIDATRMDVRALGNINVTFPESTQGGLPDNRVEIAVIRR